MENDSLWWMFRCMHNTHDETSCWWVLRESEGVVALLLICSRASPSAVHILVDLNGVGSSCQQMSLKQYKELTELGLMKLVQEQRRELHSLTIMP